MLTLAHHHHRLPWHIADFRDLPTRLRPPDLCKKGQRSVRINCDDDGHSVGPGMGGSQRSESGYAHGRDLPSVIKTQLPGLPRYRRGVCSKNKESMEKWLIFQRHGSTASFHASAFTASRASASVVCHLPSSDATKSLLGDRWVDAGCCRMLLGARCDGLCGINTATPQ